MDAVFDARRSGAEPSAPSVTPTWLDRSCIVIPAFDAEATLAAVVEGLRRAIPERAGAIIVVDDGSRDATARVARDLDCTVVASAPHASGARGENVGKGAALRAGFEAARAHGMTVALTVDADGQHPPDDARRVLFSPAPETALVLGVRDLVRDGAPRANRFSNGISNVFLSLFARKPLRDTQCGLRRYPVATALDLPSRGRGYDFEAEVLLRAVWAGVEVVEEPVFVVYPEQRRTHFRISRDPWRIIATVLAAVGEHWVGSARAPAARSPHERGPR